MFYKQNTCHHWTSNNIKKIASIITHGIGKKKYIMLRFVLCNSENLIQMRLKWVIQTKQLSNKGDIQFKILCVRQYPNILEVQGEAKGFFYL